MAARKSAAPSIPALPQREGMAYAAEELAPVITAMLAAAGIPKSVSGLDVRNVVRGKRKGIASPVPRLLVKPALGNRDHTYTLTEAADVLRTFAQMAGLPDKALPAPFAGHESGARPSRAPRPKPAARKRVGTVPPPEVTGGPTREGRSTRSGVAPDPTE